ncbi:hypothetical protein CYG48_18965 (plasmid) [Neorhizobium sp. SOG26]|uniref:tripartite tricarboxylate transporter TctB family protein n=1 Tax=Neorhizobium sp. SOG26 TaxID=2060726 RepID=UPI000E5719DE|nr:tripartite tricarboxylate transporter TctB family protein [Neorhizobium sp. SOG26]AXV17873.1 hypothetical protein CYG48_18965 [Neorhizobium sp. SOG26]
MAIQEDQIADLPEDDDDGPANEASLGSIGFAAVVAIVGIVFFWQSLQNNSPAGLWPRMLAGALVLLAGAQTVTAILTRLRAPQQETHSAPPRASLHRKIFTAAWLLVYCLVAQLTGFGPAMLVFVPAYMLVMGYRNPIWIVVVTAAFALGLTLMFDTVANVPVWSSRL